MSLTKSLQGAALGLRSPSPTRGASVAFGGGNLLTWILYCGTLHPPPGTKHVFISNHCSLI